MSRKKQEHTAVMLSREELKTAGIRELTAQELLAVNGGRNVEGAITSYGSDPDIPDDPPSSGELQKHTPIIAKVHTPEDMKAAVHREAQAPAARRTVHREARRTILQKVHRIAHQTIRRANTPIIGQAATPTIGKMRIPANTETAIPAVPMLILQVPATRQTVHRETHRTILQKVHRIAAIHGVAAQKARQTVVILQTAIVRAEIERHDRERRKKARKHSTRRNIVKI